jgi:hypothetical protein
VNVDFLVGPQLISHWGNTLRSQAVLSLAFSLTNRSIRSQDGHVLWTRRCTISFDSHKSYMRLHAAVRHFGPAQIALYSSMLRC